MKEILSFSYVLKVGKLGLVSGCFLGMVIGCSSNLRMMSMSETEPPSTPQVAQVESGDPENETVVQAPVQKEIIHGIPPIDIPVEEPARPSIRSSAPADVVAAPQKEVGEVAEPDQAETITGIPPSDIPVEEPAHPHNRPSAPAEIFATPRAEFVEPAEPESLETPLDAEPVAPSPPVIATAPSEGPSQESHQAQEIPPMSFEPEKPVLPTIREEGAPPEESIASAEPAPIEESISAPPEEAPIEPGEQAPKLEEPVQMAKVDPEASEPMERRMEDSLKVLQDVYFDYDRFTLRKEAIPILQENAEALLSGLSDKHLVIEGHCDERGTESYNMVLGERRASAVKGMLVDLGVPSDKLQVVSYGKEKPFCTDQNEQCWQENRRGHFVLK